MATDTSQWPSTEPCLHILDSQHRRVFDNAIRNILLLDVAEKTLAQILDGLPMWDAAGYMPSDHPVVQLNHRAICDGFMDKFHTLRQQLDTSTLQFEPWIIKAFQESVLGTKCFALRLVELVVIACHQIAANFYECNDGAHPHRLYQEWFTQAEEQRVAGKRARGVVPMPVAFSHHRFYRPDLCPRGEADVAAYWAEGQIFGGVVVFDRGPSGRESNSIWLHGMKYTPSTLYPPTDQQMDALIAYLLTDNIEMAKAKVHHDLCPLPMHATQANRPRWDPWEAQTKFHIFRDKHALCIPSIRTLGCTSINSADWPELQDQRIAGDQLRQRSQGEPWDPEVLRAALVGACLLTPTSPLIEPKPDWYVNSVWKGR